jgi:hypothetical protein
MCTSILKLYHLKEFCKTDETGLATPLGTIVPKGVKQGKRVGRTCILTDTPEKADIRRQKEQKHLKSVKLKLQLQHKSM